MLARNIARKILGGSEHAAADRRFIAILETQLHGGIWLALWTVILNSRSDLQAADSARVRLRTGHPVDDFVLMHVPVGCDLRAEPLVNGREPRAERGMPRDLRAIVMDRLCAERDRCDYDSHRPPAASRLRLGMKPNV